MPLTISYEPPDGVRVIGEGTVSGEDLLEANAQMYSSPQEVKSCNFQIIDFTNVNTLNLSNNDVEKLIAQDSEASKLNPNLKIAVVAKEDNIYSILKMWQSFTAHEAYKSAVFRKLEDAFEWVRQ